MRELHTVDHGYPIRMGLSLGEVHFLYNRTSYTGRPVHTKRRAPDKAFWSIRCSTPRTRTSFTITPYTGQNVRYTKQAFSKHCLIHRNLVYRTKCPVYKTSSWLFHIPDKSRITVKIYSLRGSSVRNIWGLCYKTHYAVNLRKNFRKYLPML